MVAPAERRAALLLLALAGAGLVVRLVQGGLPAPGGVAYRFAGEGTLARDAVAGDAARLARPLAAGERVDLDRAPAVELVRLPRIGPSLAARIVADREGRGPYGSLEALRRVPGIGEATLEALRPFAAFSGRAGPVSRDSARARVVAVNRATAEELRTLPGIGPGLAAAIIAERARGGPYRSVDDLQRVPGIGPVLVQRLAGRIRIP